MRADRGLWQPSALETLAPSSCLQSASGKSMAGGAAADPLGRTVHETGGTTNTNSKGNIVTKGPRNLLTLNPRKLLLY